MQDITELLNNFRECARHTWNAHFLALGEMSFDQVDDFRELTDKLFDVLICRPLELSDVRGLTGAAAAGAIRIVPKVEHGCPIQIHRPRPGTANVYWDDPVNVIKPAESDLRLVGYFDFHLRGFRDLRYVEVNIARLDPHPELTGRRALIETQYVTAHLISRPDRNA